MDKYRHKAICNLYPDLSLIDDDGVVWKGDDWRNFTKVVLDEDAITTEVNRLKSLKYKTDRANSYPSIGDQLDMQYHDAVNGTTTWKDAVAKVKADNPKPGGGE